MCQCFVSLYNIYAKKYWISVIGYDPSSNSDSDSLSHVRFDVLNLLFFVMFPNASPL